jgi:hypothetical protein
MANIESTNPVVEGESQAIAPKGLLRLVYILGIVLVLLFLALIGGIIWKANKPKPIAKPEDYAISLGLKAADVKNVALDSGQVLITTGQEIIVLDVTKKKILLREPLAP